MKIKIIATDLHVLNMRTRMPFRYGIAEMTALPHLFVRVLLQVDGKEQWGIASEGLPPKWFTKNPNTHFKDDLDEMLTVIRQACLFAEDAETDSSLCLLAMSIYWKQNGWGEAQGLPPLLSNLGYTLIERAMIDGFCRLKGLSFADAVHSNALGFKLDIMHPQLDERPPSAYLPPKPLSSTAVRHTIGFGDPLTDADIPDGERLIDGLPQTLEASIKAYGLTHFKIKVNGDIEADLERLRRIAGVLAKTGTYNYGFTLDGNEQFEGLDHFEEYWEEFTQASDISLKAMQRRLLFVEQPFPRLIALNNRALLGLWSWEERPPIIIDESDGEIHSFAMAVQLGYCGTSHKNCKGVLKGIANACYAAQLRAEDPTGRYIISGEDLANVGPVALLQDLTVMATLGISHVERNGHHYFRGLSAMPQEIQQQILQQHGDLYRAHDNGFPTLNIQNGQINLRSVVDAPFGLNFELDSTQFTPLDKWRFASL